MSIDEPEASMSQAPHTGDPVVLHVVESFGAGTANAVLQYVRSTPSVTHHLLRHVREGEYVDQGDLGVFASVRSLSPNLRDARRDIRKAVETVNPSVVHGHSSFGGAFVRLSIRSSSRQRIVYTPHSFSFEREDLGAARKLILKLVERALAWNTDTIAACSPREMTLAQSMRSDSAVYVPNISATGTAHRPAAKMGAQVVAGAGRLSPQRDPDYFIEVVRRLRRVNEEAKFIWVGGGDQTLVDRLHANGISVTGWLSHEEALDTLSNADLYIHTAAWDGFPLTILEAHRLGTPILARHTSALEHAPSNLVFSTVHEITAAAAELLADSSVADEVTRGWEALLAENTVEVQSERLMEVYRSRAVSNRKKRISTKVAV
ncbi:glycosyltransferase [Microterricola pindariensis]|uniref:Glycosyltransferase subfamily 4-like N-terminal domain-containing protein n=1 Tax=Microterricola pindariensis TaxID=478010 RepID=A0ABX5AUH0_9MICO|nr:glycosyltransferase [Microterricola pindariensis]PPL15763.1 hypothetical protein GY24_13775 [Microterricola pindariensis]